MYRKMELCVCVGGGGGGGYTIYAHSGKKKADSFSKIFLAKGKLENDLNDLSSLPTFESQLGQMRKLPVTRGYTKSDVF